MITLLVPALYLLIGALVVGLAERLEHLLNRPLPRLGPMRGWAIKLFAAMLWPLFGLATLQDLSYLGWCYLVATYEVLGKLWRQRRSRKAVRLAADSPTLCSSEPADFTEVVA